MLAHFPHFSRAVHVANGVPDIDEEVLPNPGPALQRIATEFLAGTLGRVSAEKGIPELLAAARDCTEPSIVFTVAGAGALVEQVAAAAPNVRYVGYFTDPRSYLAGLDVYVQASRREGLSLALLEAMRAGKPIVATDVGDTRGALVDGESALLVPPGQPERLLEAVLTLRRDPALVIRLGRNARLRYEADFQMHRQHERFLHLYFPESIEGTRQS
jgi:glycosyltransferase involved in cell wall biosynthesis